MLLDMAQQQQQPLPLRTIALGAIVGGLALYKYFFQLPRRVKYAKGDPVLGRLRALLKGLYANTIHDDMAALFQSIGQKTYAFHILGAPFVATIDPQNLQHFLKDNFNNYIKGSAFRSVFTEVLGDGIFNVDGKLWFKQRKISSKMFTNKIFNDHIWSVVAKNTQGVCDFLKQSDGKTICMFNLMNRYTLDTIGEIGFSKNIGSLVVPSSPFLKSFDAAQATLIKRFWMNRGVPIWRLLRLLGLGFEKEFPAHLALLNEYSEGIVTDLMAKGATSGGDPSFVGLFMQDPGSQELLQRDEKAFRQFMRDMVLNFLIAGRDTTAQCLTWTFCELAQHPEVVERIRKEVADVVGSQRLAFDHVKQLRYTKAVLDEGLRLHPSVPIDSKLAVQSDVLPDGTCVPAGCIVMFVPYSQGRCKDMWGSDALDFKPERWLDRPMPSPFEFSAFNAGPRECLGKRLAELEMVALLATVVPCYDFTLDIEPRDVKYDMQLTLGCSTGLPMNLHLRQ